jgi:hypothetical protein
MNAGDDLLEQELMLPSVTEIVVVDAPVARPTKQVTETGRFLIGVLDGKQTRTGSRLGALSNAEAVHVVIGPAHDDLQYVVKAITRDAALDLESPPDRRLRADQCQLQLVDRSRGLVGPALLALRHQPSPDG